MLTLRDPFSPTRAWLFLFFTRRVIFHLLQSLQLTAWEAEGQSYRALQTFCIAKQPSGLEPRAEGCMCVSLCLYTLVHMLDGQRDVPQPKAYTRRGSVWQRGQETGCLVLGDYVWGHRGADSVCCSESVQTQ